MYARPADTDLLVIGAGPYGVATAARAIERGIATTVVGKPMSFWIDNMPAGMFLRSGPDWHLDASGEFTFEAYLAEQGIDARDVDPVPIAVFLGYAQWFQQQRRVSVDPTFVTCLRAIDDGFEATFEDGRVARAGAVVAAPGIRAFRQFPEWVDAVPRDLVTHTCDFVEFDTLRDARVLIVGGRQSAYEWAALIGEAGAARIDVVHRHDMPRFDRASWKFVDDYVDETIATPGWWRSLPAGDREAIGRRFWEVGRLTLEWWLTPRLAAAPVHTHANTAVVEARATNGCVDVMLSDGDALTVDRIVCATGYRADVAHVSYLAGLAGDLAVDNGFPVLDAWFQSSVAGLYLTGFVATQDFGPFFGFTKACPAAATLIVDDLVRAKA